MHRKYTYGHYASRIAMFICVAAAPPLAAQDFRAGESLAELTAQAESGDAASRFRLGYRYERALGGVAASDLVKAYNLYCAAARSGDGDGAYRLGRMYWTGLGVAKDTVLAVSWLAVAAKNGNVDAARMLRRFPNLPTPTAPECRRRQPTVRLHGPPADLARYRAAAQGPVSAMVRAMAPEFGLDPELVLAVVAVESDFRPNAVSHRNAQGLMQLIPETARRFGVRDPFDPVDNLAGGMRYLRWLLAKFNGDVKLALAGYNAGEGAVLRYGGVPPYPETVNYVDRVGRLFSAPRHPYDPTLR
ncbi:MAG TPA: transglycosylase SLT domain-containing protein [Azospirillaceae bacterium]|nr:transglycosylase SLT domain-containing protein [Azospirillaceae bacterium]HRQ83144.1 transglycosylase SLT domain-containing protein [Azospirillaceae bacterium]